MHVRPQPLFSHPSSSRTILSSLVPPLFTPFHPSPLRPSNRVASLFRSSPFSVPPFLSFSPSLLRSVPRRSLLSLFTSLFALSPFSSSESGLIHWKLFICLIATRRPGSSTLRRGKPSPPPHRRVQRGRPPPPPSTSTPIPIRGVTTTSFAFHSVTTRHSREKHFVDSRTAIVASVTVTLRVHAAFLHCQLRNLVDRSNIAPLESFQRDIEDRCGFCQTIINPLLRWQLGSRTVTSDRNRIQ